MDDFCVRLVEQYGFIEFCAGDRSLLDAYEQGAVFFDLCFTNFWVWKEQLSYVYRIIGDTVAVVYVGLDGTAACILLPGPSRELREAIILMQVFFAREGRKVTFEYVPEQWLELYRASGIPLEISADRDWSDYLYLVSDFAQLDGGTNKFKRRELSLVLKQGQVEFRPLSRDNLDAAVEVFRKWCNWHDCKNCVFGCEQRAFERVKEIWDDRYYGGVVYLNGEPVAFALAETLHDCACYSFQKNADRFRGLTYYLSYHCTQLPGHPPKLNWCEDMGLEGLRENKLRYRPWVIVDKYCVRPKMDWPLEERALLCSGTGGG